MSIVCIVIIIFSLFKLHIYQREKNISRVFNIDIKYCDLVSEINTHGGFLGDGEYLSKLKCSKFNVPSNWKKFPLSEEIDKVLNIISCYGEGCKNFYDRYDIPIIEKGYYYFIDRHSESIDSNDEADINNRSSYNFSLIIYDEYNKMIYCYELDT